MTDLPKSDLLRFVERAAKLACRAVDRYSSKYSKTLYTLRQHVVLLCLKVKKTTTDRDFVDELIEMPRIRDALNLDSIPSSFDILQGVGRLEMAVWWVLLNVSLVDLPLDVVAGIDASGFERAHAPAHYTTRENLQ